MRLSKGRRLRGLIVAYVCLILTAAAAGSVLAAEKPVFTVQDAVALALEHSPVLKIAEENWRRTTGAVRTAKGSARPSLGISGTYIRYDKVEEVEIAPGQSVKLGQIDARNATATIAQPIDISGIIGARIDAAEYERQAAEFDLRATREDVALAVQSAYLGVMRADDNRVVAAESVERLRKYLALAEARVDAGTAARFDILRAKTEVANAEQGLIAAENALRIAHARLANTIGRDVPEDADFQLPEPGLKDGLSEEKLVEQGLANRPEAASAAISVKAAERGIHVARMELRPTMQVSANYNYRGNTSLFQPREFTSDAMLAVSLPIFDGGVTRGRVEQARATTASAMARKEQVDLNIKLDVQQACSDLQNAQKRLAVAEATLEEARESLRLADVRYESGVSLAVEVTDAQVALTSAETNLVGAKYDVYLAQAQLNRAIGSSPLVAQD